MRFLSVAERELRAAARRSATYYVRWITGIAFFVILVWLLWISNAFQNQRMVTEVFQVFSILIFFYCLIVGTARTADCLSSEKREGTLGLLYLTNLNSAEIVAGKLCSNALAAVYGLVAIFPILALPLLMGGVTAEHFWRMLLALLNTIFFAVTVGTAASSFCVRQFPAVAMATGLAILFGAGMLGVAEIVNANHGAKWCVHALAVGCPLYSLLIADGSRMYGANHYWLSILVVAGLSLSSLVLVAGRMSRSWQDRPQVARSWNRFRFWQRQPKLSRVGNAALRRRLLGINPFFWLAGRNRVSSPIFMVLVSVIVIITAYVTTPFFGQVLRAGINSSMIGSLFAWVWAGLAVVGLSLYYAAMIASQRLAEDKQVGALEMILCTPTNERSIARGLWLAYGRRMLFPALSCLLIIAFFIWQCMIMATLEPPGGMKVGATESEYFWAALYDQPLRGKQLDWGFVMILQVLLRLTVLLILVWVTLGCVGRWLGLRMKHPGFAPMLSLALVFVPPVLCFSLFCAVVDEFNLNRLPERQFIPKMMWVAFGIGVGHCLLLCWWAMSHLRRDFRTVVTSRFQPPALRRWWRPGWRGIRKFVVRAAATAVLLILLIQGFYSYENWRSKREWKAFQAQRAQRGEAKDFILTQPRPVPAAENFAQHPAFQRLLQPSPHPLKELWPRMSELDHAFQRFTSDGLILWPQRTPMPLNLVARWINPRRSIGSRTNNAGVAPQLLADLATHQDTLTELAAAARRPFFQLNASVDAIEVIRSVRPETTAFERVQFLFVMRAAAAIEVGNVALAAEDVVTSLKMACLARQTMDTRASLRQQVLLMRSFQPFWEGLRQQRWTAAQLVEFEREFARFDLLADHTNAIHRGVTAYLQVWEKFPNDAKNNWAVPEPQGGFLRDPSWAWQPHAGWYDRCRQLYELGQTAIRHINLTNGTLHVEQEWNQLDGLQVGSDLEMLIEPYYWRAKNATVLACAQTALHQARVAAALERHWLATGSYPKKLDELVPVRLERVFADVVTGRPMLYERIATNQYVLRSVGLDGADDRISKASDDWLWAYPTNTPPAVISPAK